MNVHTYVCTYIYVYVCICIFVTAIVHYNLAQNQFFPRGDELVNIKLYHK